MPGLSGDSACRSADAEAGRYRGSARSAFEAKAEGYRELARGAFDAAGSY